MGKGFNNYMCKKFFHPASRDNLKRVWMAEQKAESYKKKQEELRVQYEKEQDLYTNKAMLSKESKDKLSVNFMYEPPPGTKKEREREDDEPEYKFEWQRKFNAPREDYCKGDSEIRDQPFGIQVRNVRCIKCHKWGHINTDKECPMYNQASNSDHNGCSLDPFVLIQQMREDGLAMKRSALGIHFPDVQAVQPPATSEEDNDKLKESEIELLKSLTRKQKEKLLRRFKKMEKREKHCKEAKKKGKKKKNKKKSKRCSSSDGDSSTEVKERTEECMKLFMHALNHEVPVSEISENEVDFTSLNVVSHSSHSLNVSVHYDSQKTSHCDPQNPFSLHYYNERPMQDKMRKRHRHNHNYDDGHRRRRTSDIDDGHRRRHTSEIDDGHRKRHAGDINVYKRPRDESSSLHKSHKKSHSSRSSEPKKYGK